ncbi:unnamed protein product, partial [Mesorhabditis belari]|uniref:Uncharacterized protein n=1 Tax=Mesorhabditis belari TaxID=2138241 RepID=A0AAF3F1L7_9BILA
MRISRKIFGILCAFSIAACITNIVATFSSEWRTLTSRNGDVWKSGLFKWNCRAPQPAPHDSNKCDNWWQNQNDWEVVVVISMIVAFASMCLGLVTTTFPREILCTEDLATHDIDIPDIPDFVVPQQAEASTVPQDDFVIPDVPDFYVNNGAIPENPGNDL